MTPADEYDGPRDRSHPLSGWRWWLALTGPVTFFSYALWTNIGWANRDVWFLIVFYSGVAVLTLVITMSGLFWRSFTHLPVAEGRVLAIIPVYNEEPEHVREAVLALVCQTRPPEQIHIIDDGSSEPLETFDLPGVFWHRQENAGKREAQATVLAMFEPDEWDFILTVDSDSICDADALEHMLRSMSDPQVMASTGMILMRNYAENLLTRVVDINIVSSCLMFRMVRSKLGVVSPTSGALALYRAPVVYDNLDDYLNSGTAGDDRRLSFYALLRGEVVGVHEAVVETYLPSTYWGTFHQRLRWSKSAWLGIPFAVTNLGPVALFFYMYPLVFALLWPVVVTLLLTVLFRYENFVIVNGILYWLVVVTSMTLVYAVYRPDFTWRQRLGHWLLSPAYWVFGLVLLRPAMYWALTQLRSTSWHTRELPGAAATATSATPGEAAAPLHSAH